MKRRRRRRRTFPLAALFACFCAGILFEWALRTYGPPQPAMRQPAVMAAPAVSDTVGTKSVPLVSNTARAPASRPTATTGDIPHDGLRVPIEGSDPNTWKGAFAERRGNRPHEAVDILAPRNTPVHAVTSGSIAKLFLSKAGGNTIYQFDDTGRLCYYYAHLERYANGLHEGDPVSQGQIIGYVGTSGNAPPDTPHLHFAVLELNGGRQWWQGQAIDPYAVFHR